MRLFKKKEKTQSGSVGGTSSATSPASRIPPSSPAPSASPVPSAPPATPAMYLVPPGAAEKSAVTDKSSYGEITTGLQNLGLDKQLLPGEKEFREAEYLYNLSKFYEALELYEKAIANGYLAAYFRCWIIYDQYLPERNAELADNFLKHAQQAGFPWCMEQAKIENITAKYILGCYHFFGIGGRGKDYGLALKFFREAASAGDGFAQNLVGVCYEYGNGATADPKEAVKWYTLSANQSIAWGEYHLGVCLLYGKGIKKDAGKGIALIRVACDKGLADALNELGFCYMKGIGVGKNPKMAVPLFEQSANKGNADAMCSIGACHHNGEGVAKNKGTAIQWYTKAKAKDHATAISNLEAIAKGGSNQGRYHYYWFRY